MPMSNNEEKQPALDPKAAQQMLDSIFSECEVRPNNVPMEALSAYAEYRSSRFRIQRVILAILIVLFLLLPLLFIPPRFSVTEQETGGTEGPVYAVQVDTRIPVRSVTAWQESGVLAVEKTGSRSYTVEPVRNGDMAVAVTLLNRQSAEIHVEVEDPGLTANVALLDDEAVPLAGLPQKKGPDAHAVLILCAAAILAAAFYYYRNRERYRLLRIRREGYRAEEQSMRRDS